MEDAERYRAAFADWLACAIRGTHERAALAAHASGDRAFWLGTAGHALDFDDTFAPGLAHCSAPTAPAALVAGAECGATMRDVLGAYARGFEAMAAVARASHPSLYERGWHPTSVCGVIGSAFAAAALVDADGERAVAFVLLRAGGRLEAFGSDAKPLQVGMAASAGVHGARLAAAGATVDVDAVRRGFEQSLGATWAEPDPSAPAIRENWIKVYPCCLQTHSGIEAAEQARRATADGSFVVRVHPLSVRAAPYGVPSTPLEAKFSIPYTVAFTLLHGPPDVRSFHEVDPDAARWAGRIAVETDAALGQSEAVLHSEGTEVRVMTASGSPERPLTPERRTRKIESLTDVPVADLVRDEAAAADVLRSIGDGP